jgi:hypothetical protein
MKSPLTSAELNALRRLTHGSVRERIHSRDAEKFVELGYARATADGVAITKLGLATLASHLDNWPLSVAA